jgi:hypothetical protein
MLSEFHTYIDFIMQFCRQQAKITKCKCSQSRTKKESVEAYTWLLSRLRRFKWLSCFHVMGWKDTALSVCNAWTDILQLLQILTIIRVHNIKSFIF